MLNKKQILNEAANSGSVRPLSDDERKALKQTLLDMTAEIDAVCRKHNIKMFLAGGSLLGAVRHGGFIPWDDDVDFGMTRDDYTKFISIFDKELGEHYYLRCPNSPYPNGNRFMQIFKKGTVLETAEGNTPLQPKCVLIDVFPYDGVPDNLIHQKVKGIWCNFLMIIASSVTDYTYPNDEYKQMMNKSLSGRLLHTAMSVVGFLFSWRSPAKWFNTVDNAIQFKKQSHFITSATGRKHYLGETFPNDVFLPLQEIKFENLKLYAPANPDAYLRHNYGDNYMTPPPDGKRESHFVKRLEL
ncbi:MAG: LicD family protein [Eubacterium sp.]|nr:LicD family protein [Eubacterium sp.]